MADNKISALNPATTPLAGTEELAIVQGGETKKVAASELGGTASSTYLHPVLFSTAGAATLFNALHNHAEPFTDKSFNGVPAGYLTNVWIMNGINNYDVFVRFDGQKTVSNFIYSGYSQFTNMTIDTCQIYAITDPADLVEIENTGVQADVSNMTKIWDSTGTGTDAAFPATLDSDTWDYMTDLVYTVASTACYGLVFRPATNKGHASRTLIYKLLFY